MKKTKQKILRLIVFLGLIQLSSVLNAQVAPNIDWVQHYVWRDSTDNSSTTLDADNNVYVTGYAFTGTDRDLIVLKYDSLGTLLWSNTYDNGGDDVGTGIKVDITGNVFVCGTSYDATSQNDVVYFVYSSNGTQLSFVRYDAGYNLNDEAVDLKINNSTGDAFVIGTSDNGSNTDALVIKYNPGWSIDWANLYDSPYNSSDVGVALTLTSNNDIFCTGNAFNGSDNDIWVFMLDNSGSVYWNNFVTGNTSGDDLAQAIVTTGDNAVVCGQVYNNTTNEDYTTFRIDGSANIIWQQDYDNSNNWNFATSLVRDSTGNIGTTGLVLGGSGWEYHTIMYDSTGTQLWVNVEQTNLWGAIIEPRIAVDTVAHHFYVSGSKQNTTSDVMVYQITPTSGTTSWRQYHDGPAGGFDVGTGIAVSGLGVIYLSANEANTSWGYNQTTIRISQTPYYFPVDLGTPELNDKNFVYQKNNGQVLYTDATAVPSNEVTYFYQGKSPAYFINKGRLSSLLLANDSTDSDQMPDSTHRVDFVLHKYNPYSNIYPSNEYQAKTNYFFSNPSGIINNSSYEKLSIPNIYHNVDLHYYSNTNGLKMYFVFKTSTALADPLFRIDGADSTKINGNGELIAYTNLGIINYGLVTAYQVTNTAMATVPVSGSSAWNSLGGTEYNFNISGYIPNLPIIVCVSRPGATSPVSAAAIDNLQWSTFLGNVGDEDMNSSTTDSKDNYYTVGYTYSANFPGLVGPYKNVPSNTAGVRYGILNKFDKNGTPVYGTYIGGNTVSNACSQVPFTKLMDVTVDSLFNIYLVGVTSAYDVPMQTSGTFNYSTNSALAANGLCTNALYVKLNPTGNALRHSTYYGGTKYEEFKFIKYRAGQIICGGWSQSSTIPLVTPAANSTQLNTGDGMFVHLDTAGNVIHNTKISAPVVDGAFDSNGNMYLTGTINNNTMTVVQPTSFYATGPAGSFDWFINRFNSSDSITWATYFGGSSIDRATSMCIRDSVMAIVGYGLSSDFPWQIAASDSGNNFVRFSDDIQMAKFNLKNGSRLWVAAHATWNNEQAYDVALDKDYNMFVTGNLQCATGTTVNCTSASFRYLQATNYYFQSTKIGWDAFLLGFSFDNKRKWTTSFGTTGACSSCSGSNNHDEWGKTLAINSKSQLFMGGFTRNRDNQFPLAKWNSVCYYDSTTAEPYPSPRADMYISMFDVNNFKIVNIKENETVIAHDNMLLYPNPNDGRFNLSFLEVPSTKSKIRIINVLGQTVFEHQLIEESKELPLNLDNLKSGIYFLTLTEGDTIKTIKFIIN